MEGNVIEFFCFEKDKPYDVQLEPEAFLFYVSPQKTLKFIARCNSSDFQWALRIQDGIQLFPDTKGQYEVDVYENDVLLDWYK